MIPCFVHRGRPSWTQWKRILVQVKRSISRAEIWHHQLTKRPQRQPQITAGRIGDWQSSSTCCQKQSNDQPHFVLAVQHACWKFLWSSRRGLFKKNPILQSKRERNCWAQSFVHRSSGRPSKGHATLSSDNFWRFASFPFAEICFSAQSLQNNWWNSWQDVSCKAKHFHPLSTRHSQSSAREKCIEVESIQFEAVGTTCNHCPRWSFDSCHRWSNRECRVTRQNWCIDSVVCNRHSIPSTS